MRRQLLHVRIITIFVFLLVMAFVPMVNAEIANHVVISEVYIDAVNGHDSEWIELYNPTDTEINIAGWWIDTSPNDYKEAIFPSGAEISAYGFYLLADGSYNQSMDNTSWPNADYEDEISLANSDAWIRLNDSSGDTIDLIGYGGATIYEGSSFPANPPQNKSLERKTNATTIDHNYGNAWDSDDNSADFLIQDTPNPQNSTWTVEHRPRPPVPELPSIILFAIGLITLAGYVLYTKKK